MEPSNNLYVQESKIKTSKLNPSDWVQDPYLQIFTEVTKTTFTKVQLLLTSHIQCKSPCYDQFVLTVKKEHI